jgi:hypothetical protein
MHTNIVATPTLLYHQSGELYLKKLSESNSILLVSNAKAKL